MSRLGFKSVVYHGDTCLGELDTVPISEASFQFPNNEVRIHHLSPQSERCPPLSILQAISPYSVRCKLESSSPAEQTNLILLHASLFHEFKTAVVLLGEEEIHLVAMPSKQKKFPCFWCYSVPIGLYHSCLGMLNTRCLSIVFDLDETLIVANTLKSFEDKIEALKVWIARESDPIRVAGMSAEMKRYSEDRVLLKQYADNDCVVENGKVFKVQMEEVPPLSDGHVRVVRPVIRFPEKNVVLTRINPEIRDTSVLVRLRPAWEDLRSYLTAKGRKRFEVYVCTMAERDYAFEMWRLLDPESHLIDLKQLRDRVVCVKSASRKSLLNVFRDGICHPKMAMVIDDRLKVWEDKDQPRVHVVPPFLPYYAPQAETANAVPILCVARNVACNVRGCFFREFDENLLRRISEVFYEDEVLNLPPAPDVSSYLMTEDVGFASNGNTNAPIVEGVNGADVGRRLNHLDEKHVSELSSTYVSFVLKSEPSQPPVSTVPNVNCPPSATAVLPSQKPSLLGASVQRDNSSGDSDSETKRRVPGFKSLSELNSQSSGQSSVPTRVTGQNVSTAMQPQGGCLDEEDEKKVSIPNRSSVSTQEADPSKFNKVLPIKNPFFPSSSAPTSLTPRATQRKTEEMHFGLDAEKQNISPACPVSEVGRSQNYVAPNGRDFQAEGGKLYAPPSHLCIGVLQEIARRCSSKVEFRPVTSTSKDLLFSVEVLFSGEKIGVGMGKTRKDAQQQGAEHALRGLAEKYMSYATPRSGAMGKDLDKNDNGFLWDTEDAGSSNEALREDNSSKEHTPEPSKTEAGSGSTSSSSINQQAEKLINKPKLLQYTSKRSKEEHVNGSRSLPPSKLQKTSHVS